MNKQICINSPAAIAQALSTRFMEMGVTQKQVELDTGVDQSQVCRLLSGRFRRYAGNVELLCKYANIEIVPKQVKPEKNQHLMDALHHVWDGTDEHAQAIAQVLRAVGGLRKSGHTSQSRFRS